MSSDGVSYTFEILKAVEKVNANQKLHLLEKFKAYFNNNLQGKQIALWGLAFKPNTDDISEAPALSIIEALTAMGAMITAYDPEAMPNVKAQIGDKNHTRLISMMHYRFIDLVSLVADNKGNVLVYTPDGKFISHDTVQFTKFGASVAQGKTT